MEVFGFQQGMTHCSKVFGCHSPNFFRVQRTCVDTWVPLLPWTTCPRPAPKLVLTARFIQEDVRGQKFLLGICGSVYQVVRAQRQEEEGMRVLLDNRSVVEWAE